MVKPPEKDKARVFFALWPDADCRTRLAAWQRILRLLCDGRAMREDTLHVTLVFIGEVAAQRLEALEGAAREVAGEPSELVFDMARYWPHNGIVHAATAAAPQSLMKLVENLQRHLADAGFKFDVRPYTPHVTLLRNAKAPTAPLPAMERFIWPAREFVLVQSVRDAAGANYRILARFPLGGQPDS